MKKEDIFNIVVEHAREVLPELEDYEIKYTDKLVDLGANSIDRADIVAMTMESLEIEVPRVELAKVNNIGELVEVLYEKLQSA